MTNINLLPREEGEQESFNALQRKFVLTAIFALVTTAVLTVGTLTVFSLFTSKRNALVADIGKSSVEVENQKSAEEALVVVKGKAQSADKILNARINLPDIFAKLVEVVPQGVYFTDMRFAGDSVTMTGKAQSSAHIAGLTSALVSEQGRRILSNVSVDSLSSDTAGIYTFVVSAKLIK